MSRAPMFAVYSPILGSWAIAAARKLGNLSKSLTKRTAGSTASRWGTCVQPEPFFSKLLVTAVPGEDGIA